MTSPAADPTDEPITSVVLVVLVPAGAGNPPPLVSFIAEHAGGLGYEVLKVSVHIPVAGMSGSGVPSVTLPAASDPAMDAPVAPQSIPSEGIPAKTMAEENSTTVPATMAAIAPPVLV